MSTPTTSKLTKVYDLQVVGSNDVYSELDKINKLLIEAKRNAKALRDELGKSFISEELKKLQDKIANLEKQQADLIKQMKEQAKAAENNAKIVTEATKQEAAKRVAASKEATDKINADSKRETETKRQQLLEQKKLSEQERTEAARKVKEMKDLQLQQKQAKATQFTAQQNAAPGSYYDIANQYRKLSQDVKSTIPLSDQAAVDAALANLTKLKEQLDNFARNLTKDKTLVGEYSTGVIQAFQKMGLGTMIADQVNTAKKSLDTLNAEFEVLRNELGHVKQTGQGSLDAIERQLVENRQAALQLTEQIDRVEQSLRGVGGFGTQLTEALGKEFKGLKQHMMEMVVGFVGIQQMIEGIRQSAHINYELSDTFSDIKNRIHGTDEEVQHLFESLKKLDTRTSLQGLTDIAAIVAKKGVAREEIAGITQAIDNLMLVLGGETGDVKETTSSLVKLVTIFSEDKHVTADNINSIGGAIAKLTTSGVATGSFLIDFAERMGGIKGVAGFTIDKILGLGASLEELGQSAEVSGTAMSQVIIKLFTDTQHYADLTGMSLSAFKQSLATDVVGTLVKVAEALKGNAGEMEHFFEGVEEMHNKGARVVGVLGDLATNGDYVRKRMQQATVALHQNNLVTDMAAEKQKNFAATVDNIKKSFEVLITSQGFRDTFNLLGEFVITLVKNLPELIKWGTALAAVWLLSQGNLLLLNLQLRGYQLLLLASRGAMVALTAAQTAYTTVIRLYTGSITLAEAATALFNRTLLANPFAAVITVVSALAAAVIGLGYAITNNTDALTDQETRLKTNLEIEKKVTESTSAQIGHIRNLIAVIKDKTASHEVQAKALEEVVKTSGDYLKGLTLENAATMEGIKLVDQYIDSLKKKAAYQAAQQVNAEKYHQDAQLQALEMSLQEKKSAGKTDIGDMTDDEKAQLGWFSRNFPHIMQLSDLATTPIDEALTKVRELREKLGNELDITNKMVQEKYKAMLGDDKYTAADAIGYTEDHAIGMRAGLQAMDKKIYWRKPTDDVSDLTKKKEESEQAKKVHDLELAIEQTKKKIKIAKRQHKEGEVMELKVELEHLRQQLKEVKGLAAPHGSRLTTEEYEKFKLINEIGRAHV